jgi:hypothetical protein
MALEYCSVEDRAFDVKEFSRDENGRRIHTPPGQSPHLADRTVDPPRDLPVPPPPRPGESDSSGV